MSDHRGMVSNLTYSDQARGIIRQLIFDGTYAAGQRLKETEIARELGISRAPTREAIQGLANEGLVEIMPHKGAVVATFDAAQTRELYEVREALETMAVRLAAERATSEQLESLREMLKDTADVVEGEGTTPYPADLNFHTNILYLTGNPRLQTLASETYAQLRLAMLRSGSAPGRAKEALAEHTAVFDAIRQKDPDGAEQAMRFHIRNGLNNMTSILAQDGAGGPLNP